jgi:putative SbcD/Mre11-related phosphoesterase
MEIIKNIEIRELALFLKKEKILIIGDTHIGLEEALNKEGFLIPRFQYKEIEEMTKKILKETNPKLIIMNGDIKHEFGKISDEEWRYTLRFLDLLLKHSKVILIKGNHDNIIGPIGKKRNLEIKDYYFTNNIYICHGHKIPNDSDFKKSKIIIIGHEHPAISLREGARIEKYKCYLKGKYQGKQLIVMPSLNVVNEGTDILQEELLSPFLTNIKDFEAYLIGEKIYPFGKIKRLLK